MSKIRLDGKNVMGFLAQYEIDYLKPQVLLAEKMINEIIFNADIIVIRPQQTKIYLQNGQGISITTKNGEFTGFVELLKETEK